MRAKYPNEFQYFAGQGISQLSNLSSSNLPKNLKGKARSKAFASRTGGLKGESVIGYGNEMTGKRINMKRGEAPEDNRSLIEQIQASARGDAPLEGGFVGGLTKDKVLGGGNFYQKQLNQRNQRQTTPIGEKGNLFQAQRSVMGLKSNNLNSFKKTPLGKVPSEHAEIGKYGSYQEQKAYAKKRKAQGKQTLVIMRPDMPEYKAFKEKQKRKKKQKSKTI